MGSKALARIDSRRNRDTCASSSGLARPLWSDMKSPLPNSQRDSLELLSVVIPARDEEGCISSTVEHLYVELRLHAISHEIVVVDDGSTDSTWSKLLQLKERIPTLRPIRNEGAHGFGRAIICGLEQMEGDAVVIMMADESDDCRDVVR